MAIKIAIPLPKVLVVSNKVLVSACLLGERVRYDGKVKLYSHPIFEKLIMENRVISCCPEVDGGLSIPRIPSEIQGNRVVNQIGIDVTSYFIDGAKKALVLAKRHNIKIAILKSKSPSCSNNRVYDGNFSKTLKDGMGITAALLEHEDISVFNEDQLDELLELMF